MKTSLFAFKILNADPHMQRKENMGDFFDIIQGDSGGKANILGGDSMGHCEVKRLYEQVYNYEW